MYSNAYRHTVDKGSVKAAVSIRSVMWWRWWLFPVRRDVQEMKLSPCNRLISCRQSLLLVAAATAPNRTSTRRTLTPHCPGWPKKVSHYQESSSSRIENRQWG